MVSVRPWPHDTLAYRTTARQKKHSNVIPDSIFYVDYINGTSQEYLIVCVRYKVYERWADGAAVMTFLS